MNRPLNPSVAIILTLVIGCQNKSPHETRSQFLLNGAAGKIFVDRGGSGGLPVIMVHSLAGNTTQWQAQLDHLRKMRLAVAFDMRGHGKSDLAVNQDYSLATMAQDVAAVVDSLEIKKFILIGHSYGGGVIATYAGQHPERVAGLLFVDPIGDIRKLPQIALDEWIAGFRGETYADAAEAHWRRIMPNADSIVANAVIGSLKKTPKEVVVGALEATLTFAPVDVLKNYHGPMQTIVSGLPDNDMALHHAVPNLPHVVMPNTGHWLQMERPEEFNLLMDRFLDTIHE